MSCLVVWSSYFEKAMYLLPNYTLLCVLSGVSFDYYSFSNDIDTSHSVFIQPQFIDD